MQVKITIVIGGRIIIMKKLLLLGFHPACLRFEKSNFLVKL